MAIKPYILFDLDGTLTDPGVGITRSVQYALRAFGIEEETKNLTRFIGPPLRESFKVFYGMSDDQAEQAVEKYREYFGVTGMLENCVYEGIAQMLRMLQAGGATLLVATSKPTVYAGKILSHFELDGYFTFTAGSELDGRRSNKAEVIQYALESREISPADAVMVGDRKHDIVGAQENGVMSVGVLYGYGDREELAGAGADVIVESVDALARILSGI